MVFEEMIREIQTLYQANEAAPPAVVKAWHDWLIRTAGEIDSEIGAIDARLRDLAAIFGR